MNKKGDGLIIGGAITNIVLVSINMLIGLIIFFPMIIMGSAMTAISGGGMNGTVIVGFDGMFIAFLVISMLIGFAMSVVTIVVSVKAMKNPKYKTIAGVFGIITNLIGGILILCGNYTDENPTV